MYSLFFIINTITTVGYDTMKVELIREKIFNIVLIYMTYIYLPIIFGYLLTVV